MKILKQNVNIAIKKLLDLVKLLQTGGSTLLGMVLVFVGFGSFQVSETAIKQPQNLKLM